MSLFKRKEFWVVVILLVIVFVGRLTADVSFKYSDKGLETTVENVGVEPAVKAEAEPALLKVDISGAVVNPGVYTLKDGDRIEDVIILAGGFTREADIDRINQADHLYDGQKIVVLEIGEVPMGSQENAGPVNINTASLEQLMTLSGIGEKTAEKIINYRQQEGPFKSVDDLTLVSGIGPSKLDTIRGQITVK